MPTNLWACLILFNKIRCAFMKNVYFQFDWNNLIHNFIAGAFLTLFGTSHEWVVCFLFFFVFIVLKWRYSTVTPTSKEISEARANIVRQICLEEHVAFLESSPLSIQQIESSVSAIRSICGVREKFHVAYETLLLVADRLNIQVHEFTTDLTLGIDAFCLRDGSDSAQRSIYIQKNLSEIKKSFSLAHEIGHLVLGHELIALNDALGSFKKYRTFLRNEFEANHFAGALLIDKKTLHHIFSQGNQSTLEDVCEKFGAEYETIVHRLSLLLTNKNLHFIKIDTSGRVIRRFSRARSGIYWSSQFAPCDRTSTLKLLKKIKNNPAEYLGLKITQISKVAKDDGTASDYSYFCISKVIIKHGKFFIITIGSTLDDAGIFAEYNTQPEIETELVSPYQCDVCRLNENSVCLNTSHTAR